MTMNSLRMLDPNEHCSFISHSASAQNLKPPVKVLLTNKFNKPKQAFQLRQSSQDNSERPPPQFASSEFEFVPTGGIARNVKGHHHSSQLMTKSDGSDPALVRVSKEAKVVPMTPQSAIVQLRSNLAKRGENIVTSGADSANQYTSFGVFKPQAPRPGTMVDERPEQEITPVTRINMPYGIPSMANTSTLQPHSQPVVETRDVFTRDFAHDKSFQKEVVSPEDEAVIQYWRNDHDAQFIYEHDRRLSIDSDFEPRRIEGCRWSSNDIKRHNKSLYVRQVIKKTDKIQTITKLDRLEQLEHSDDKLPCLNIRKMLRRMAIFVNLFALNIIKRKSFEACTIIVIIANCMTLTMSKANVDPTETEVLIENVFQALYTIEMVLKILGMGFIFNKGAYLRDYFNILDFFIVGSAYLSMMQPQDSQSSGLSLSSLRAFRVLKPLRAVNNIPGLRLIVQSILKALPLLKDTIIVLMFFFLIFAIGGVNLFSGMLRQRCIEIDTGRVLLDASGEEMLCGVNVACSEGYFCGKRILNPNYDVTNFDNIFWALLAIFQCVTLEGWSDMMVMYQKVYTYQAYLFFVPLVFIGAFFLLNLTLAVINTSFNDAQEKLRQAKEEREAELRELSNTLQPGNNGKKNDDEALQALQTDRSLEALKNGRQGPIEHNILGLHEFFVAKRAANRLKEFTKLFQLQKQRDAEILILQKKEARLAKEEQTQRQLNSPKSSTGSFNDGPPHTQSRPHTPDAATERSMNHNLSSRHDNNNQSKIQIAFMSRLPIPGNNGFNQNGNKIVDEASAAITRLNRNSINAKSASSIGVQDHKGGEYFLKGGKITEEAESYELNPSVKDFLEGLENEENDGTAPQYDANMSSAHDRRSSAAPDDKEGTLLHVPSFTDKSGTFIPSGYHQGASTLNLVMAYNDMRRANDVRMVTPAHEEEKVHRRSQKNLHAEHVSDAFQMLKHDNLRDSKERQNKLRERIREELDFDRVMQQRERLGYRDDTAGDEDPKAQKLTKHGHSQSVTRIQYLREADQHPFDLSFITRNSGSFDHGPPLSERAANRDLDKPRTACDDEKRSSRSGLRSKEPSLNATPTQKDKTLESLSVISSDSSIASRIDKCQLERERQKRTTRKLSQRKASQKKLARDFSVNLKNLLASEQLSKKDMNKDDSFMGTTSIHDGQSKKKQIDIYSNLVEKKQVPRINIHKKSTARLDSFNITSGGRQTMTTTERRLIAFQNESAKRKTRQAQRYVEVRKGYLIDDGLTPFDLYDKKQQKVIINPGEPYISSSQADVFELRAFKKQQDLMRNKNRFIKIDFINENMKRRAMKELKMRRKKDLLRRDSDELSEEKESYLPVLHKPYQLKRKLQVQKVIQVDFDDDDEDALILQQQPFETVMSICFSRLLSHLSTKFLTRRSDIIVSSTMSITLAPEDKFVPTNLLELGPDQILDWCDLRENFRAHYVKQVHGGHLKYLDYSDSSDDEGEDDLNVIHPEFYEKSSYQDNHFSKGKRLPNQLLNRPLSPDQTMLLCEHDKREYNLQRQKYEAELRKIAKNDIHPRDFVFDLETAQKLVKGEFQMEDDNEDEQPANQLPQKNSQQVFLGRETLKDERRLDEFEIALKRIIEDGTSLKDQLKELNSKDHIPEEIKEEFNLPKDMQNHQVNFEEVRLHDTTLSIKHPVWSGQEVLETSLNFEQSQWITKKLASIRVWPKGYMNVVKKVRSVLKVSCINPFFEHFMTFCVIMNTVVMSMDRYGIDQATEKVLSKINAIFTYIFIYEMSVKLLAIGPKKYTASKWNLLDGSVVLLSIVEIIVESQSEDQSGGSSLSAFRTVKVFRTFRVMRVARILRALHSMQVIIGVITRSFRSFMYVILLLFVFVFIYALLGVQIYQGNFDFGPNERIPRGNFEDFANAFVTTFQVMTMENWQDVMYSAMRSAQGSIFYKSLTAIYFVSWIFIGNFILLNLFLAILIDSFSSEETEASTDIEQSLEAERKSQELKRKQLQEEKQKRLKKLKVNDSAKSVTTSMVKQKTLKKAQTMSAFTGTQKQDIDVIDDLEDLNSEVIRQMLVKSKVIKDTAKKTRIEDIPEEIFCKKSIYLFDRSGCFRRTCYYIQKHRYFDRFIMFLIAVSSMQLAVETYIQDLPEDDTTVKINAVFGEIFTYLFSLEFLFKLVALGFVMDEGSYLRESWNQLDFFIVATSIIDNMLPNSDIAALQILRMLRILRPLRVVSHNLQLKMIVIALLDAGGSILNVIIVVLVVWLMFAIFAVNTYKGTFFYCSVNKYQYLDKYECIAKGGEWLRYDSNFDDIGQAMTTLFIVSSLEGWPSIMYQALDSTKADFGPKYQNSIEQSIFFIFFILVGSFFFLNFFIGVLFLKYSEAQKREVAGYTEEQLRWGEMQAMILKAQCPHSMLNKPSFSQKWRLKVWTVVTSPVFETIILAVIFLNMIQMAIMYEGSGDTVNKFMETTNLIFTAIFIVEAALKIFSFGLSYFETSWNKFDFFVVISSILDISLSYFEKLQQSEGGDTRQQSALSLAPQLARVLRVLRVSRVMRIAGHYKGLQSLFNTIMLSITPLVNVFMLLMLFFFILATLGQFMFNGVKTGEVINDYKNFTVFDRSFLLLFSVSTGEDWNMIMHDCSKTPPNCTEGVDCGSSFAAAYFMAFVLLVTYVMLNLFILVIIQQFQKLYLDQGGPLQLFNRDFNIIVTTWVKFTGRQRCLKLKNKFVFNFMKAIPAPLGFSDKSENELNREVIKMDIKSEDGWIYFNELLYRIMRNSYGNMKLNKNMQIKELITQYKLFNLTMKQARLSKANAQQRFFTKIQPGGRDSVNPFLTKMYFKISFISWLNYAKKVVRYHELEKARSIKFSRFHYVPQSEEDLSKALKNFEDRQGGYETVEIEVEHFSEWSVTSDEDGEETPTLDQRRMTPTDKNTPSPKPRRQLTMKEHREFSKDRMREKQLKFMRHVSESMSLVEERARHESSDQVNSYLAPENNLMVQKLRSQKTLLDLARKRFGRSLSRVRRSQELTPTDEDNSKLLDTKQKDSLIRRLRTFGLPKHSSLGMLKNEKSSGSLFTSKDSFNDDIIEEEQTENSGQVTSRLTSHRHNSIKQIDESNKPLQTQ